MFGRDWESGQATIVAVRQVMTGFSPSGSRAEFVADVQPEGLAPAFRATFKGPRTATNFEEPAVGDVVPVKFHSKSSEVKFDTADPSLRRDAAEEREQERFDAIASAPPGTAPPAAATAPAESAAPPLTAMESSLADVSAAVARMSATTADASETIAAIRRARAAGDLAEVERLKADYQRRSDAKRPG